MTLPRVEVAGGSEEPRGATGSRTGFAVAALQLREAAAGMNWVQGLLDDHQDGHPVRNAGGDQWVHHVSTTPRADRAAWSLIPNSYA